MGTRMNKRNDLKNIYDYDQKQKLILFNNTEIIIGGKQCFGGTGSIKAGVYMNRSEIQSIIKRELLGLK